MAKAAATGIEFSQEDSDRLMRLSEEVRGRLQEMALIASRLRGVALDPKAIPKFVPKDAAITGHPVLIEILDLPDGTCCVVWEHVPGVGKLFCPC